MLGSGMNLVTTVIGFGMSATFIVFVCTRLICGRVRPSSSDDDPRSAAAALDVELRSSDLDPPEHAIGGLESVVIAAFPKIKYHKQAFRSNEDLQCSICLGEYQEKEMLRIMPTCGHDFHLTCIDVWLEKQSTCPICRLSLHDSFEAKYAASPFFGRDLQSVNGPEAASDHSHQWLLPSHEHSESTGNNREIHESVNIDLEHTHVGQPEARR